MWQVKVFLDIGAHDGETLEVIRAAEWGFDRIVCFEPAPSCWPLLEALSDERVEICRFGLWSEDATLVLHNPGHVGASLSSEKDHVEGSTECEFRDAATWFEENLNSDDEVFAKVNVEGAEVEIIERLHQTSMLAKIDHLLIHFDIRKVPGKAHMEPGLRRMLDEAGVEYLSADVVEFGVVTRGTRNWLRWCSADKRTRDVRYLHLGRVVFFARRTLYPLKVAVQRMRQPTANR
jgi:FkbM family methyltransferase